MIKHKKYIDIEVAKEKNISEFLPGDHIIIQEKIDGANAAIRYDAENDIIVAQSRNNILDSSNNLRGFYEWTQTLSEDTKAAIKSLLGETSLIFGEWLIPHSVKYPDERYNHFYMYDIYDTEMGCYASQADVKVAAIQLGIEYVPVLYDGEFQSWEHCKSFVGQTRLGGEYGEGIVVKNQTAIGFDLARRYGLLPEISGVMLNGRTEDHLIKAPFYLKIVGDKFKETKTAKKKKEISPEEAAAYEQAVKDTETIVTEARVRKMLHKLVDEGILPEVWSQSDMATVAKNLPKRIFEDCVKEEPETVKSIPNFSKHCNRTSMILARSILDEKTKII